MSRTQQPGSSTAPLLEHALELAARGWHVFPCIPGGKKPALRGNWRDLATTRPDRIRAWWTHVPYNIGIACGPSGLVVIDLDVPHGHPPIGETPAGAPSGAASLAALCERHGQPYPPPTYAVGTPSGGFHLYYAAPGERVRNSAGRLGPRIDIRASGGYVIGDGSRDRGRPYTARDQRLPASLPRWITALLRDDPAVPTPDRRTQVPGGAQGTAYALAALREEAQMVATAQPGARNDTLNRAAFSLGQLTAAGLLPQLAVITALASAAKQAGLPGDEAQRTICSGLEAGMRRPRNARG